MLAKKVQIIEAYVRSQGIVVTIYENPDLSLDNPGSYRAGTIKIFNELLPELKHEAVAHELCHAIFEHDGVISIDTNDDYYEIKFTSLKTNKASAVDYSQLLKMLPDFDQEEPDGQDELDDQKEKYSELFAAVSNAIHHKFMIPFMINKFEIVPCEYFKLMHRWLIKTKIVIEGNDNDTISNYKDGVFLYDIANTLPFLKDEITRIASINAEVNKAYSASNMHLNSVSTSTGLSEQFEVVSRLLTVLDVEPDRYKIYDHYGKASETPTTI